MRDYGELLRSRLDLEQYGGFLTTKEKQEQAKVQKRYDGLRKAIVYDLLRAQPDPDDATATMRADMDAERPGTPDTLLPLVDQVEDELTANLARDGGRKPWARTLRHRAPWIAGAVLLAVYFGIRLYNAAGVDAGIETRAGLEQRAAATIKTLRHAGLTDVRRNRMVANVLFWPIAPSDAELTGTGEFTGMVAAGRNALIEAGEKCAVPAPDGDLLTDEDLGVFRQVADAVVAPGTKWVNPPVVTLLPFLRTAYRCR